MLTRVGGSRGSGCFILFPWAPPSKGARPPSRSELGRGQVSPERVCHAGLGLGLGWTTGSTGCRLSCLPWSHWQCKGEPSPAELTSMGLPLYLLSPCPALSTVLASWPRHWCVGRDSLSGFPLPDGHSKLSFLMFYLSIEMLAEQQICVQPAAGLLLQGRLVVLGRCQADWL